MATRSSPSSRADRGLPPALHRLLVATDFSPTSRRALLFATRILPPGGRIRLAHALSPGDFDSAGVWLAVRKRAREWLDAEAEAAEERGIRCGASLLSGAPDVALCEQAESFRASATVCGTHGRRGLGLLLLGSIAEKLLQRSTRPLIVVPHVPVPKSIRRVLLATDFSPRTEASLAFAERLCRTRGWRLEVLHVVDSWFPTAYALTSHPSVFQEMRRRRREASARLAEIVARLRSRGVEAAARLETGHPADRVLRAAEDLSADLLVVGKRGAGGEGPFVGSTSREIVRRAPCAVAVVPQARRR
jgi:nucleotide-binding universal stress UspA family protein